MNTLFLGLSIAGGIALLAAWCWLAWALRAMAPINGRLFRRDDLASIAAIMAAGADVDFLKQVQTLVDLANEGFVGLAEALLLEFWKDFPPAALIGMAHAMGAADLVALVSKAFDVSCDEVDKIEDAMRESLAPDVAGP